MAADLDLSLAANQPFYVYDVYLPEAAPGACTDALAGAGAGLLSNGDYLYKITLVTAEGETELGTASGGVTVADYTANGKVALSNIPTGTAGRCTARKIYRTKAGGSTYYYVATIADNSTTTYTDNTADTSLTVEGSATSTSGIFNVKLPSGKEITIAHTGLTTAGGTSGSDDCVVIMHGDATFVRSIAAGAKAIVWANGDATARTAHFHGSEDGDHIIQIGAVTTGGRVQFAISAAIDF